MLEQYAMTAVSFLTIGLILGAVLFLKDRFTAKPESAIWIDERPYGSQGNCYSYHGDKSVKAALKNVNGLLDVYDNMFIIDLRYNPEDVLREVREVAQAVSR